VSVPLLARLQCTRRVALQRQNPEVDLEQGQAPTGVSRSRLTGRPCRCGRDVAWHRITACRGWRIQPRLRKRFDPQPQPNEKTSETFIRLPHHFISQDLFHPGVTLDASLRSREIKPRSGSRPVTAPTANPRPSRRSCRSAPTRPAARRTVTASLVAMNIHPWQREVLTSFSACQESASAYSKSLQ